ncbi:MAG: reverse transcriptase domain-containing protein [Hellea sp.]
MGDNVIQAKSIFDEIRNRGECIAIALDLSKFFDKIEHAVLKDCLGAVLGGAHLSRDDYHIWRSVCKYAYVNSEQLKTRLGKKYNRNGRICSSKDFRNVVRGKDPEANLVESNDQHFGIPQGLPISGLYANISLIDFDDALFSIVKSLGGVYKRYSDDLALVVPIGTNTEDLINEVSHELTKIGLSINSDKTEVVVFSQKSGKLIAPKPFQYLGFTFDGERILIRQSSIHNYYRKMRKGIRAKVYAAKNQNIERNNIYMRQLFKRYTHFGRKRNFPRYAYRAARILESEEVRKQLSGHMGKFKRFVSVAVDEIY